MQHEERTFQRHILPPSSRLKGKSNKYSARSRYQTCQLLANYLLSFKMEAICSSELTVNFYQTTLRYIPEDSTKYEN
jgi:hypothetical protein